MISPLSIVSSTASIVQGKPRPGNTQRLELSVSVRGHGSGLFCQGCYWYVPIRPGEEGGERGRKRICSGTIWGRGFSGRLVAEGVRVSAGSYLSLKSLVCPASGRS